MIELCQDCLASGRDETQTPGRHRHRRAQPGRSPAPDHLSELVLPAWKGSSGLDVLSQRFGVPLLVDNDANLGALAEHWWGAGRGVDDFAYIKLATGIGSGHIIGGRDLPRRQRGRRRDRPPGHRSARRALHLRPARLPRHAGRRTGAGRARRASCWRGDPDSVLAGGEVDDRRDRGRGAGGRPARAAGGRRGGRAPRHRGRRPAQPAEPRPRDPRRRPRPARRAAARAAARDGEPPHAASARSPRREIRTSELGPRAVAIGAATLVLQAALADSRLFTGRIDRRRSHDRRPGRDWTHGSSSPRCSSRSPAAAAAPPTPSTAGVDARAGRTSSTGPPGSRPIRRAGRSTSGPTGATTSSSTTPTGRENVSLDGSGEPGHHRPRGELPGAGLHLGAASTRSGLFEQARGRFEARIKLPVGPGHLAGVLAARQRHRHGRAGPPAARSTSWSTAARSRTSSSAAVHGPGYSGGSRVGTALHAAGRGFNDDFHVFAVEWDARPDRLVRGRRPATRSITPADLPPGGRWVFDHPFFIILNVAVGGNFVGPPGREHASSRRRCSSTGSGCTGRDRERRRPARSRAGLALALAALIAGVGGGCARDVPRAPAGVLVVSQEQQASWIRNFNPLTTATSARWPTLAGVYEPLFVFNSVRVGVRALARRRPRVARGQPRAPPDHPGQRAVVGRAALHARGTSPSPSTCCAATRRSTAAASGASSPACRPSTSARSTSASSASSSPASTRSPRSRSCREHVWSAVADPVTFAEREPGRDRPLHRGARLPEPGLRAGPQPALLAARASRTSRRSASRPIPSNDRANLALVFDEVDWAGNFIPADRPRLRGTRPGAPSLLVPAHRQQHLPLRQHDARALRRRARAQGAQHGDRPRRCWSTSRSTATRVPPTPPA